MTTRTPHLVAVAREGLEHLSKPNQTAVEAQCDTKPPHEMLPMRSTVFTHKVSSVFKQLCKLRTIHLPCRFSFSGPRQV